jgi:tetratricopeptide (TPR) repeat protein
MQDDAARDFQEAEALCNEQRYAEALEILDDLDAAYPNAPNIMYLRAVCLGFGGDPKRAKAICRRLLREFTDMRAIELLRDIRRSEL